MDTPFKQWLCTYCGYAMDTASGAFDKAISPQDDDIAMCLNCGGFHTLKGAGWHPVSRQWVLDTATPEDRIQLAKLEQARRAVVKTDLSKPGGHA